MRRVGIANECVIANALTEPPPAPGSRLQATRAALLAPARRALQVDPVEALREE